MLAHINNGIALLNRAGDGLGWLRGADGSLLNIDHDHAVMRGDITGAASFSSNGVHEASGAESRTPITPNGLLNIPPAAGVQMTFASSSAEDSASGTGIRTMTVGYIEAVTLLQKTEIVALNGVTGVLSSVLDNSFINSMTIYTAGSAAKAVGNITASVGGTVYGIIAAGAELQESSYRFVPYSKTFFPRLILASSISATSDTKSLFRIMIRPTGFPYFLSSGAMGVQNSSLVIPLTGRGLTAGSIFGVNHTTDKAAAVTAAIIGYYEDTPQ